MISRSRISVRSLATLSLAGILLAGAASALTVDEVVARHVEAHGGEQAWRAVSAMKLTGQFTAFSKIHPFTLYRQRAEGDINLFYSDQIQDDKRVRVGHNGSKAWTINGWMGGQEQQLTPEQADYKMMVQDAEMVTPFFAWKERGYEAELLGEGEVDGIPVVQLKLKRHGWEETWHLDPETFLEVARDAPASEFGSDAVGRTFYDDFRQVGGLVLPHYLETQWYTRNRVYEIENVELNPEIEAKIFDLAPPEGMGELLPMVGTWEIKVERRGAPEAPWDEATYMSTITSHLGDAVLQEHMVSESGGEIFRAIAFDRFKGVYRIYQVSSETKHPDILVGTMEDGRLSVSNAETDTAASVFGRFFYERSVIFDIGAGGFKAERETSFDGENWYVSRKMTYIPKSSS